LSQNILWIGLHKLSFLNITHECYCYLFPPLYQTPSLHQGNPNNAL
jgi:hypothetical protein